uniref:Golgin subfamily A member 6-like protein 22 n=1 Tax=Astyanax mexicanus TaxID=7994 RepID=A0A3B1KEX0_ASTMX
MASSSQEEFTLVIPCDEIDSIGSSVTVPCHLSPDISADAMEIRWFKGTDCVCLYKNRQVTEGRGFEDRVNLFREELERGDVSLQLRNCTESDSGSYLCQVKSDLRTEEITAAVQMVSDDFGWIKKMVKVEAEWTEEERMKMEESAVLTEFKASNMVDLVKRMDEERRKEQQQLKEARICLDNILKELEDKDNQLYQLHQMLAESDKKIQEHLAEMERHEQLEDSHCAGHMETEDAATSIRKTHSQELPPDMNSEPGVDSSESAPASELRLVLLGRTGCEMSAAGDTILGGEERSQTGASTVRQQSESRQGEVAGRKVTVVETPDWFSPESSLEELRQDVGLCVRLSAPGPHAFLLVIPVKQSIGEVKGMVEKMEEIFWEMCWKNTMILFTVTGEQQKKDIELLLNSSEDEDIQRLVEKCENRFHCLNIKESGDDSQVSELLEKIKEMVKGNGGGFYSSEIYREIREMEKRITKEREENKQREIQKVRDKLEKEVQDALMDVMEEIQELEKRIQQHEEQILELERLLEEERNDETKRELEIQLKKEIQLRKETEQKLRELKIAWDKREAQMKEKHRQEMDEIIEMYEGEVRLEAERNLMKIILPELHRTVWVLISKMQKQFLVKMGEKESELMTLKRNLAELQENYRQLENDYQTALKNMEDTEAGGDEERTGAVASEEREETEQSQDEVERLPEGETDDGEGKRTEEDEEKGGVEKTEAGDEQETTHDGQEEARGIRQLFNVCCCFVRRMNPVDTQ